MVELLVVEWSDAVLLRLSPARKMQGKLGRADPTSQAARPTRSLKCYLSHKAPSFKAPESCSILFVHIDSEIAPSERFEPAIWCCFSPIDHYNWLQTRVWRIGERSEGRGGDLKHGRVVRLLGKLLISQVESATTSVHVPSNTALV